MTQARVFFPQDVLEGWVSDGRGQVVDETLILDGVKFSLASAVRFTAEVAGGGDEAQLVGKVKSLPQIEALGGEHCAGSVVLGDNAYEVHEGFVAVPETGPDAPPTSSERLLKIFRQR